MSIKSEIAIENGNPVVTLMVDTDEGRIKLRDIPDFAKGMAKGLAKQRGDAELKKNPSKRRGPKPVKGNGKTKAKGRPN